VASKSSSGSGKGATASVAESPAAVLKLQKDLSAAMKEMNELRRREYQLSEEVKSLNRALANELGDGVTVEQSLAEGGWRGRAQQIVMLKAKIRKLESGAVATGSSSSAKAVKRNDVDAKAEAELANMVSIRSKSVCSLVSSCCCTSSFLLLLFTPLLA
jgi:cell division protein FtsB